MLRNSRKLSTLSSSSLSSSQVQIIKLESNDSPTSSKKRPSRTCIPRCRWLRIISVGSAVISLVILGYINIMADVMIEKNSRVNINSIKKEVGEISLDMELQITMRSAVGFPHELSNEQMIKRRLISPVSLVISHCDVSLDWIPNFIGDQYHIQDITVYSKCGKEVKGLDKLKSVEKPQVIRLPNLGRCDHSYAHWIKEHYRSIDKDRDGDEVVFFVKDNNYHQNTYRPFSEIFTLTSELGFGCALKPIWCDCPEGFHQCSVNDGLMLHNQTEVNAFEMHHRHVRLDRDGGEADTFVSKRYPNLRSWKDSMGLITTNSETLPVCYGGVFAAKKGRLLNQSLKAWENVEKSLTREDNLVEGHYAERLWAGILSKMDDKFAHAVDEFVIPVVNQTSRCMGRPGMILIPRAMSLKFL